MMLSSGRTDAAERVVAELTRLSAERYVSPVLLAQIAAGLGDADRTLRYLEDGFDRDCDYNPCPCTH